jgi:diaminopimelate epimerase
MTKLTFTKMHGLGNDFVVLDARAGAPELAEAQVRAIADRRTGVGCDQLITIESSDRAAAFMRVHNADGGEVPACGNGARCVASRLMDELAADNVTLDTSAGVLEAVREGDGSVTVDMGLARLDWRDIPLATEMDTLHLDLAIGPKTAPVLADPVAVNVGNPHAVFFVEDVDTVDLQTVGPILEHHPIFPLRANISVAAVRSRRSVRLRVWERGVGITHACGTAACATVVAGGRRDLLDRDASVEVELDGGILRVTWRRDGHVAMNGPVAVSFSGVLDPTLLRGRAE